jgi:hypothetical protein
VSIVEATSEILGIYIIFQTSPHKEEEEEEEAVRPTYKGDSLQSLSLHLLTRS